MPRVTSIQPQRRQNRVNIYLDDKFGFGLDLENYVKLGLKIDQELSQEEVEKIVKKAEFSKIYEKLLKFAMLRPRSQKEIKDWFRKKQTPEMIQEELFNKLKHLELLDDAKFAQWWVEQRNSFKPRSKRLLKMELIQKGINSETITEILAESGIDELKIAMKLAKKKRHLEKERLISYLARKGFSWETIDAVLSNLVEYKVGENAE